MSLREDILSAVMTGLTSVTGVPNASIFRSRVSALARRDLPAIIVEPVSDSAERNAINRTRWKFVFQVMIFFRGTEPDAEADETIESVHAKIMGNSALQALLVDLMPIGATWQFGDTDTPQVQATLQFMADYQTSELDISA